MIKLNDLLTNHIRNWKMAWFGLIFWGSVLNALAINFGYSDYSALCFFCGFIIGLIAKVRGTWLWKI